MINDLKKYRLTKANVIDGKVNRIICGGVIICIIFLNKQVGCYSIMNNQQIHLP